MKTIVQTTFTIGTALGLAMATVASAAGYTWNYSGNGYWTNAANWLPVGVPAETDTVKIGKGRVYVPTELVLALDDFHLYGGEIRGTFDVRGFCEWTNGVIIDGATTIRSNASLRLTSAAIKTLSTKVLNNEGWVAWTNACRLSPDGNTTINNQPGGTFEVQDDGWVQKTSAGLSYFNNYGVFRKTGGTNATWFSGCRSTAPAL